MKVVVRQHVTSPFNVVKEFYSDVSNLKRITPSFPRLTINKRDTRVVEGRKFPMSLDFILFKVAWLTRIDKVVEGEYFIDTLHGGIFKLWRHTHGYEATEGGTLLTDEIEYESAVWFVPLVYLGLKLMFAFRTQAIAKVLG